MLKIKQEAAGIKHTNKHNGRNLFCSKCSYCSSCTAARPLLIRHKTLCALPSSLHPRCLAPHYRLHARSCSCMPPCLLWSSQQTSNAAQRDTNHKLSSLSTAGCGARKLMRCQALLKQAHINLSVCGWRTGPKSSRRGCYWGGQKITPMHKAWKDIPWGHSETYQSRNSKSAHTRVRTDA